MRKEKSPSYFALRKSFHETMRLRLEFYAYFVFIVPTTEIGKKNKIISNDSNFLVKFPKKQFPDVIQFRQRNIFSSHFHTI